MVTSTIVKQLLADATKVEILRPEPGDLVIFHVDPSRLPEDPAERMAVVQEATESIRKVLMTLPHFRSTAFCVEAMGVRTEIVRP